VRGDGKKIQQRVMDEKAVGGLVEFFRRPMGKLQ
jgi:hypothetical protein